MDNPQKSNTTDGKPQMGLNRTNSEKKKLSRKMVSFGPKKTCQQNKADHHNFWCKQLSMLLTDIDEKFRHGLTDFLI